MSNAYRDPAYAFESYSANQERLARTTTWALELEEWVTLEVDAIRFNVYVAVQFERQGERGDILVKSIDMREIGIMLEKHGEPFQLDRDQLYVNHLLTYTRLENAVQLELMKTAVASKDWEEA